MGIIKFEGNDKMHMALGFGAPERPTAFTADNAIYFNRDK